MAKTFPLVRKGYDPVVVDAFVREQADAWRGELAKASAAVDDWRRRAGELAATVGSMEQRLAEAERHRDEQVSALETTVAELRWSRDQARAELAELRREHGAAQGQASGLVEAAREESARLLAAAEAEVERLYASARTRIAMAEDHARQRLERAVPQATVEISVHP